MTRIGKLFLLMTFLAAAAARPVAAQAGPTLSSPRQGEVLQGVVTVRGISQVNGFQSSETAFAYAGDTTGTWFLISTSAQAVSSDALAIWDTTTITDGDYTLRLRVYLTDGSHLDAIAPNLRVRNYTPIETATPVPLALQPTAVPTVTLTAVPFPTPTSLPRNPAVLTLSDVSTSIGYGGLGAVMVLILLGIYLSLRRK
jgi:hypothetical protein